MSDRRIEPAFLGPYAENDDLLEKLVVEFLRDHAYWRRNFHPEDPPVIPTSAHYQPHYEAFVGRMRRELHALSALLKRSVPFSSPRYMGHMVSDVLLPGLIAQIATLPYNPNNVVDEASPITLDLELEAGLQLARMVGYVTDEARPDCAFGYLASGGTAANYQGLRTMLAMKCYPLAVKAGCERTGHEFAWQGQPITALRTWVLMNLSVSQTIEFKASFEASLPCEADGRAAGIVAEAVAAERYEHLGLAAFFRRHPEAEALHLLVPVTAHYSWEKAMKLLGLGARQISVIPETGMRMDMQALDQRLERMAAEETAVLAVVGILGTTEFGTLDPIDEILQARSRWRTRGLSFGVHVDAAWGGYVASVLRRPDGTWRPRKDVASDFRYFPSEPVYEAVRAIEGADSITIDPHKLGYLPYGAGAYLCRDQRMMDFLVLDADYVFDPDRQAPGYRQKFRSLGRYIMEGSKSGAMAAAVWLTHRTMPLDSDHFGLIPMATIQAAEAFWDHARIFAKKMTGRVRVTVPFDPDTNLVCVALNPCGNRSVGAMNRFVHRVFEHLRVDRDLPLQVKQFFGSTTRLSPEALGDADTQRIIQELGLDGTTLRAYPESKADAPTMLILRHTLMNPWLIDETNGINYIERYFVFLEQIVDQELDRLDAADLKPPGSKD